jgi:hypothetical protein
MLSLLLWLPRLRITTTYLTPIMSTLYNDRQGMRHSAAPWTSFSLNHERNIQVIMVKWDMFSEHMTARSTIFKAPTIDNV